MKFKNKKTGFTLIELTVVISVLLGLIGLLVIGVQAYLRSVERTSCLLNISNIAKEIQGQDLLDETFPSNVTGTVTIALRNVTALTYTEVFCPAQTRLENANLTARAPFPRFRLIKSLVGSDYYVTINPPSALTNTTIQVGGINFQLQNKNRISVACLASLDVLSGNSTFGEAHHLKETLVY